VIDVSTVMYSNVMDTETFSYNALLRGDIQIYVSPSSTC